MKYLQKGKYVAMVQNKDGISVRARAINSRSKYTIEFESREDLESIFASYPYRGFEGFFASFNDRYDETGKAFMDITFKKISRAQYELLGKEIVPHFELNLMKHDALLAENVYNQLNAQAIKMEEDRLNILNNLKSN